MWTEDEDMIVDHGVEEVECEETTTWSSVNGSDRGTQSNVSYIKHSLMLTSSSSGPESQLETAECCWKLASVLCCVC